MPRRYHRRQHLATSMIDLTGNSVTSTVGDSSHRGTDVAGRLVAAVTLPHDGGVRMFPGLDLEYLALAETHYRQTALYPVLTQRAQQRTLGRPTWQQSARWHLGTACIRLGEHLRTMAAAGPSQHRRHAAGRTK